MLGFENLIKVIGYDFYEMSSSSVALSLIEKPTKMFYLGKRSDVLGSSEKIGWDGPDPFVGRWSGTVDAQGKVSSNKGSLLYLISEDLKTSTESVMGAMATSVRNLKEIVEAGVNPEKSLKRKYEEHQEQQRVEDQQKEAERLQKEQEDQERQQMVMMIHPYTGAHMYLTGAQKEQFIRDLATMKPSDFVSNVPVGTGSMGAGTPPIPPQGSRLRTFVGGGA